MLLIPARPGCDFAAPAAQMLDLRRQLRGAVPIVLCDCGLEGADLRRARELTERYDDLLLLTAAEIEELKRYPQQTEEYLEYAARTVTAEEAGADIDLLFRALRAAYGAYGCFDRAQFDAAEQAALDWANGQKGDIGHKSMAKKLG